MDISVSGLRSKKQKKILAQAVEFYASLLMTKRMAESIEVRVVLKNKLDDDAEGLCHFVEKDVGYREFEIELTKHLPLENLLTNLAHEMVHLKQFATGELHSNMIPANITKWHGKPVNESRVCYWDLPWEIEAHGRERGLFYRFIEKTNIYT